MVGLTFKMLSEAYHLCANIANLSLRFLRTPFMNTASDLYLEIVSCRKLLHGGDTGRSVHLHCHGMTLV